MSLTIPPYKGQGWTNGSEPDLSAETLNAVDAGITANSEAINAIANAVTNQIINDPDKIASIAVAYALQRQINEVNSNLSKKGTVYKTTLSGVPGTAEVVVPNPLILPAGAYFVAASIGEISPNKFVNLKLTVKNTNDNSLVSIVRYSNYVSAIFTLTAEAEILVYTQMTETVTVNIDERYNHLYAIRL